MSSARKTGDASTRSKPAQREPASGPSVSCAPAAALALAGMGNQALQRLLRAHGILPKLGSSPPDDPLEREAERVAEQVMGIARPDARVGPDASETSGVHLSRYSAGAPIRSSPGMPPLVQDVVRSPGQPLDTPTREFMESRFGRRFGGVRVHADARADAAAQHVGALAFTLGHDVVFRAGRYAPHSADGRRLLAHELTHVLQQSAATGLRPAARGIQLDADPQAVARAPDPFHEDDFEGWGWWLMGPTFTARPGAEQIRRVLIEYVGLDAVRMRESSARFIVRTGPFSPHSYWSFQHPVHGAVARAAAKRVSITEGPFGVYVFIPNALGWRAISGGTGSAEVEDVPRLTVRRAESSRDAGSEPAAPETAAEPEAPETAASDRPVHPIRADNSVLAGNRELSELYLILMQHFTSLPVTAEVTASASDGLSPEELRTLIGEDQLRERLTLLFTQGWTEFRQAGGTRVGVFGSLMERILEQYTRGNPTATANRLCIGYGAPERGVLGIVQRNSDYLLYDELGMPIRSSTGIAWRDHGFMGSAVSEAATREGMERAPLTREQEVDRLVANLFAQALGVHDTAMVAQGVSAAIRHIGEVKQRVQNGLLPEVIQTVGETLGVLISFMLGHALARFLMRSPNPYAAAVGLGIEIWLRGLGYLLGIEFLADTWDALMESAFHLSRVRENEEGVPTALSHLHMDEAAEPVRVLINNTAAAMTFGVFARAVRGVRRGRTASWGRDWRTGFLVLRLLLATGRGVREGISARSFEGYGGTSVEVAPSRGSTVSAPEVSGRGSTGTAETGSVRAPETVELSPPAAETSAPETTTRPVEGGAGAETAAGLSSPVPETAPDPAEVFGDRLVQIFLSDPETFDADVLSPQHRRAMLQAFMRDPAAYVRAADTDVGDTLLTRLAEEAAAGPEAAAAETAAEGTAEVAPAEATTESAAGLSSPVPALEPSTRVTVNLDSNIYYPPGTRHHGATGAQWADMTLAQARARPGARATTLPTARTAAPSGVYSTERPTAGDPRVVLRAWLGRRSARAGLERFMMSASEYAIAVIQGWQRAHASGAGLRAESGEAIRLAPEFVNQALQNRGIESFLRQLRDRALAEGRQIHVTTVVETHPRTLRLRSIEYEIEIMGEGGRMESVGDVVIEVTPEGNARAGVRLPGTDTYTYTPEFRPSGETVR